MHLRNFRSSPRRFKMAVALPYVLLIGGCATGGRELPVMETCLVFPASSSDPVEFAGSVLKPMDFACTLQDGSQVMKSVTETKGYVCYPPLDFKYWLESLQARGSK